MKQEKTQLSARLRSALDRSQFKSMSEVYAYAIVYGLKDRRFDNLGRYARKELEYLLGY